jgi:hypothetical protein
VFFERPQNAAEVKLELILFFNIITFVEIKMIIK